MHKYQDSESPFSFAVKIVDSFLIYYEELLAEFQLVYTDNELFYQWDSRSRNGKQVENYNKYSVWDSRGKDKGPERIYILPKGHGHTNKSRFICSIRIVGKLIFT